MSLSQNFPNPFNPETRIRLEIGGAGERVTLRIYDAAGRLVTTLLDNEFVVGERIVRWDGRRDGGGRVATGVYFYRLEAGGQTLSRKLAVIR
jgi:flagellar hook assembly protein FlgD